MTRRLSLVPKVRDGLAERPGPFHPPCQAGMVRLPGSSRLVWWTGRVAIGLRYVPPTHGGLVTAATVREPRRRWRGWLGASL